MRLALIFLLLAHQASAALPATGVINFRASATAGNVNGCGFNSARGGTDYTLQDAAQETRTDGAASGGTTFTSTAATFTDAMKGNYLHITVGGGLTVGWYEIVSVTDADNVVLDRTPGTGSSATYYVGGACSLGSTLDDDVFEIGVAGNVFQIKSGSYTLGETIAISVSGGTSNPIRIEGYDSTPGDRPTGSTRPTISMATSAINLGANWNLFYLSITGTASTMFTAGSNSQVGFCKFVNTSTSAARNAFVTAGDVYIIGNEVVSYRGTAINISGNHAVEIYGNYIHDSNLGISSSNTTAVHSIRFNIISDNVSGAISLVAAAIGLHSIAQNTLYGSENKLGTGIALVAGVTDTKLIGNIVYGFATGVSHADTQSVGYDNWNAYNNNTADVSNWTKGPNDVTTAPGFVGVAQLTGATATTSGSVLTQSGANFATVTDNVDFVYLVSGTGITAGKYMITSHTTDTLTLDIAPGTSATADKVWQVTTGHNFAIGANYKALAYPVAFPGGLTTGYLDIGAVQRQEPAGGSGGAFGYVK